MYEGRVLPFELILSVKELEVHVFELTRKASKITHQVVVFFISLNVWNNYFRTLKENYVSTYSWMHM